MRGSGENEGRKHGYLVLSKSYCHGEQNPFTGTFYRQCWVFYLLHLVISKGELSLQPHSMFLGVHEAAMIQSASRYCYQGCLWLSFTRQHEDIDYSKSYSKHLTHLRSFYYHGIWNRKLKYKHLVNAEQIPSCLSFCLCLYSSLWLISRLRDTGISKLLSWTKFGPLLAFIKFH